MLQFVLNQGNIQGELRLLLTMEEVFKVISLHSFFCFVITDMFNNKQKKIIVADCLVIVLMGLIPSWIYTFDGTGIHSQTRRLCIYRLTSRTLNDHISHLGFKL